MEVRRVRSAEELEAALALRLAVFSDEQGVDSRADQDGRDGEAIQAVAIEDGAVVGTFRLLVDEPTARLGRMVVRGDMRGRGVAARMLTLADELAAEHGAAAIALHAQLTACSVYDRAGYVARGEIFTEEGIDHVTMEKRLG